MFRPEAGGRKTQDGGRLDVAINRAVREMLDIEPPAGLRGRVVRRIEGADGSSGLASAFRRKIFWIAAPAAAAAILILAVIAPWRTKPVPATDATKVAAVEPPAVVDPVQPPTMVLSPTPSRPDPPRVSGPATVARGKPRVIVERMVIAATVPAGNGVEIDPLAAINPIRIAPVGSAAIEYKEVVVTPLAPIAQLQIAPLTTPAGRF
jgi:hypothetical protein